MQTESERVAILETKLDDLRGDVAELVLETQRTRKRLHDLEGVAAAVVELNKQRRREEDLRDRKYTRRLNLLMVLAAFAAVASPVVVALLHTTG